MTASWIFAIACLTLAVVSGQASAQDKPANKLPAVLQFQVKDIDGKNVDLSRYQGKVLLIVNVASRCGYTDQYAGLQALHAAHAKNGLAVLGFPCNDFGAQEPGTEAEIKQFCSANYKVQFDMFGKITLEGKDASPLFKFLTAKETNTRFSGAVRWNFEKFLIGRDGAILARFASDVAPESDEIQQAIKTALSK